MIKILVISSPDPIRQENVKKQFENQYGEWSDVVQCVSAVMYPSQPCVGILRSFKKCIEIAKESKWAEVMILEDDFYCLITDSLNRFIDTYTRYKPYKALLLAGLYEGKPYPIYEDFYRVDDKLSGLHAIIVPEGLYDVLLTAEEPYQLDYWISMIAKIPTYITYPFLILQNVGYSYNSKKEVDYNSALHLKYKLANGF